MVHKKLSPLYILAVLIEKSDYDHPMTQPEIIQEVSRQYGLEIERKAVSDTLKALDESDLDIEIQRSRNGKGVFVNDILLDEALVMAVIDSVLSSRALSQRDADEIIRVVSSLVSVYKREKIAPVRKTKINLKNRAPQDTLVNVQKLQEAIDRRKMIKFDYQTFDERWNYVDCINPRTGRAPYCKVCPVFVVNNFGSYYLVCNYKRYDNLTIFRVEFIRNLEILDEDSKDPSEIPSIGSNFNLSKFLAEHIYVFSDKVVDATFTFSEPRVFRYVYEWFGREARVTKVEGGYRCDIRCDRKALIYWAMQYYDCISITSPQEVRDQILAGAKDMVARYSQPLASTSEVQPIGLDGGASSAPVPPTAA